jgi:hypothetical protein
LVIGGGVLGLSIGYSRGKASVTATPAPATVDASVNAAAAPWIAHALRVPTAELMLKRQLDDILAALRALGLVP